MSTPGLLTVMRYLKVSPPGSTIELVGEPTGVVPTYLTAPLTKAEAPETASWAPSIMTAPAIQVSTNGARPAANIGPFTGTRHAPKMRRNRASRRGARRTNIAIKLRFLYEISSFFLKRELAGRGATPGHAVILHVPRGPRGGAIAESPGLI